MNFQNEMNRKLDISSNSENGIAWECLATVIKETGQQIVGFKEKEGLNPCFDGYEEEIVQYKIVLWNTQENLQAQGMPIKKGD